MINETNIKNLIAKAGDVKIVAAVKQRTADEINTLLKFGIDTVGENRVQDLLAKYEATKGLKWHFIGNLQTNKVKYIVDKVQLIQSVDRENLALEIQKQCQKHDIIMPVLIEVNLDEDSKGGIKTTELHALLKYISTLKNLKIQGLMFIPPINSDEETYQNIKQIFLRYKDEFSLTILSCGMSDDYEIAIKYGANMIRPGSILFNSKRGE
ncbi:MAG: YggS family pyridoxal phosphate-dependent enzyme [Firmicutes bacterium]|nr:YggS family pyridoxal phosphate-dependent enzyme [Bacillota bacterium]